MNDKNISFSIAALSRKENISRVNTRDDGREPISHFDQPFYSLLVVPKTTLSAQALVKLDTKNRLKKFLKEESQGTYSPIRNNLNLWSLKVDNNTITLFVSIPM